MSANWANYNSLGLVMKLSETNGCPRRFAFIVVRNIFIRMLWDIVEQKLRSCREKGSKMFESVTWLFLTATLCSMPFLFKIHFSFPADVFWNGSPYSPEKHLQTLYLFFYASIRSFITWNRDLEKINNWIYQKQVQLHLGYKYKEREYTFSKKV